MGREKKREKNVTGYVSAGSGGIDSAPLRDPAAAVVFYEGRGGGEEEEKSEKGEKKRKAKNRWQRAGRNRKMLTA